MPEIVLARVAADQRAALDALVDAYLAELAAHREKPVGPTCAAEYVYLPAYWHEAGRHPFFIEAQGARVGFVLVREVLDEGVIQMSDFYLRPDHRRGGIGRAALVEVWTRFPGRWELQVHLKNEAASAFWPRCIEAHATGPIEAREVFEEDGRRVEYRFTVPTPGR